jgi:glutamine amidotransferase
MCRWLAYSGPPIFLDSILFKPENSLIRQSLQARRSRSVTNGDGFGVGWYDSLPTPGLFRDTLPAWNDENLRSLAEQIRARTFLAHVRASTGGSISRSNCHPFRFGKWLFMHNGQIGEFEKIRRDLTFAISPELFPLIRGATDSELFFYLLIGAGLADDPAAALSSAVGTVLRIMRANNVATPFLLTAAASDGETIYAVRYASEGDAPSLFYGCNVPLSDIADGSENSSAQAILILSEPLDDVQSNWVEVGQDCLVVAAENRAYTLPFAPGKTGGQS